MRAEEGDRPHPHVGTSFQEGQALRAFYALDPWAATAECVNARCRAHYGLQQFPVRGLPKVACVVLFTVIAHNLLRWLALAA